MARKSTRAAQGTGTIRKKTVTRSGKEYTYWEARYTEGVDPPERVSGKLPRSSRRPPLLSTQALTQLLVK